MASSTAATPASLRWNLRGLSVISFAHGVSDFYSGIVPFTIFLVLSRDHVSAGFQGALVFVWYLTSSLVQPFFGAYTDRIGRWWFLPSSVAVTMLAISFACVAPSIWLLALCIVAGGIGSAIMHPEAGKYSAMLSGDRRAGGISIFQIGGQIGYSLGPAVVALLYARYGPGGTLWLLIPGALAVAALFAVMRRVDRSAERTGVALLVASTGLRYFVSAAFMTYLPNYLVGNGSSIAAAGQIVTVFLFVSSIGLLAGGYLSDRFGPVRISIAALCGAVPFYLGFFAVQNAPGVTLVQAMLPRNLGMALGLMNGVAFGAGSAMVALLGAAVVAFGAGPALEAASIVPLLAALGYAGVKGRSTQYGTI